MMTHRVVATAGLIALAVAMLVCIYVKVAAAQDHGHIGQGHSTWHDQFYSKLLRPDTKTSCCNLTDCRPTTGRMVDGHYEVEVNGAWVSVPQNKIIPKSAPDGGYHVCAPINFNGAPESLYCVIIAPEG